MLVITYRLSIPYIFLLLRLSLSSFLFYNSKIYYTTVIPSYIFLLGSNIVMMKIFFYDYCKSCFFPLAANCNCLHLPTYTYTLYIRPILTTNEYCIDHIIYNIYMFNINIKQYYAVSLF